MMRRCSKCHITHSIVLTIPTRTRLHFCARCAPQEAARYRPLEVMPRAGRAAFNAAPIRYTLKRELAR